MMYEVPEIMKVSDWKLQAHEAVQNVIPGSSVPVPDTMTHVDDHDYCFYYVCDGRDWWTLYGYGTGARLGRKFTNDVRCSELVKAIQPGHKDMSIESASTLPNTATCVVSFVWVNPRCRILSRNAGRERASL